MYSSESGVETDQESRSEECKLVAVIPNKAQYNSKDKLVLIFNNKLSEKGSYHAEFKGHKRSKMDVKAKKVNNCTLVVEAPIYHPVEKVNINVRHRTYEGSTIIGTMPFKFVSREEILENILRDYMGDPVTFMCESLGISPTDISALDDALAVTFKRNMPNGFNLLGLHNDKIGNEACTSLHPTLLHFAAAFGLLHLTKDCLLQCPGVVEASKMRNCRGMNPNEISRNNGYDDLADEILGFQGQQEEGIYESMEKEEDCDSEYLQMAPGYINVQLWQESYIEMEHKETLDVGEFYEDMTKNKEAEDTIDSHGYTDVHRPDVRQQRDGLYMDMTESSNDKEDAGHYVDVIKNTEGEETEDLYMNYKEDISQDEPNQELYEPMVGDTGLGGDQNEGYFGEYRDGQSTYDTPSNLPVSRYPEARSASVSYGTGGRRPKKPAKELPQEPGLPPVPVRLTRGSVIPQDPTSPRERVSSTGSKISNLSNTSTVSGASTSTTGSGHDGDAEDNDEGKDIMMSREELIRQLENKTQPPVKRKEGPQVAAKSNRFSAPVKAQDNPYTVGPLPPVPPADYTQRMPPPPVPSRGSNPSSPRGPRHERSKTTPVNPRDVELAQKPSRMTSHSIKESSSARQSQAYSRPPPVDQRRNSSEAVGARSPVDRPPAPSPPREPISENKPPYGAIPTPMLAAAITTRQEPPPKVQPRAAPRKYK